MPLGITVILLFLLGASVGSFFGLVIERLEKRQSIFTARSICDHCGRRLGAVELIPILGYFLIGGKCRQCRARVGWHYPVIELIYAGLFAWTYYYFGASKEFIVALVNILILLPIIISDLRFQKIPDQFSLPGMVIGFLVAWLVGQPSPWSLLIGGISGLLFFAVQFFASRGRWVGGGDLRLGLLLGLLFGWQRLIAVIVLGYLIGAIVSIYFLLLGSKKFTSKIALAPFLGAAALIVIYFGSAIIQWYLKLNFLL